MKNQCRAPSPLRETWHGSGFARSCFQRRVSAGTRRFLTLAGTRRFLFRTRSPFGDSAWKWQIEDAFIRKFRKIIEENLGDPSFGASQLCRALGMSRAQLYRKVKALTDESVGYHIRILRLRKARELLRTTEMNVSETAWAVGFKDLGHFSRSFREEFGVSPSEMR